MRVELGLRHEARETLSRLFRIGPLQAERRLQAPWEPVGRFGHDGSSGSGLRRGRLLVHAGLHKTGTTAIQSTLAAEAGRLRDQRLLYPQSGRPPDADGHHNVAWQLADDRRFEAGFGALSDVASDIQDFPGDALISSEDFESILGDPDRLRPLLEHPALRERAVTLVVYVREQAAYAESLYAEMLKHGMDWDARRFCDALLADGEVRFRDWVFHFDYAAMRARVLAAGAGAFVVRPYPALAGGSLVADLLRVAGRDVAGAASQRTNRRANLVHMLGHFCANRLGCEPDMVKARLDGSIGATFAGRTAHLAAGRKAEIKRRFADGNERVARACNFPIEALRQPDMPRSGRSVDMERLFSAETAALVGSWLQGGGDSKHLAASLLERCRDA